MEAPEQKSIQIPELFWERLKRIQFNSQVTPIAEGIDPPIEKLPQPEWIELEKENESK